MPEIYTFKAFNPEAVMKIDPIEVIRMNFRGVEKVIEYLMEIRPEIVNVFVENLEVILEDEVGDFSTDLSKLCDNGLAANFLIIREYQNLVSKILLSTVRHWNIEPTIAQTEYKIEVKILDFIRSWMLLKYYRVKVITDSIGREEGISLWKQIVYRITEDSLSDNEEELRPPIKEMKDRWIAQGSDPNTTSDYSVVVYDEDMFLLKVDRCGVHEVTKHIEDQEIVYLSYCWTGRVEEELNGLSRRRRTTQTLHLSDYCDEFFWDQTKHVNPPQPSHEFVSGFEN